MRGRRVWNFFLVVNNIIMNISTKFQLDFLFFEVRVFFCINAADYTDIFGTGCWINNVDGTESDL